MKHKSVLLEESVSSLNIKKNGIYIDATFGCGGHSKLILSKLQNGKLYALDCDYESVCIGKKIIDNRFKIIHCSFSSIEEKLINKFNLYGKINGILLDCGFSSMQMNNVSRGFSFLNNGPLDMRMNQLTGITASQWLSQASKKEIAFILKNYGEEYHSKKIANAIFNKKKQFPIKNTLELSKIICSVIYKRKKHHPATKSFLAIRSFINKEEKELKKILNVSIKILAPLGRLSVITFNSLEHRIVKQFIYQNSHIKFDLPDKIPLTEKQIKKIKSKKFKLIDKIFPSKEEISQNRRARSAVLRIAEFIK